MFVLAVALGLTALLAAAVHARPARARVTIRGADDVVDLRLGRRLLVVNGDICAQRLIGPDGAVVRLDRPGAACVMRFDVPGTYALRAYAGACLLPWLDVSRRNATIYVRVR